MFLFLKSTTDLQATLPFGQSVQMVKAIRSTMALIEFTPDGRVLTASKPFCQLMGYEEKELKGKHHRLFCSPEFAQSHAYQQLWNSLASGLAVSDRFMHIDSLGRQIWLEASYIPVTGPNGNVVRVIKIATDVTRKARQEQTQRSILESIDRSMAVIDFDLNGLVISANENFLQTMGYSLDEIQGRHHAMFCDPNYAASSDYKAFWHELNQGKFVSGRFERMNRNGDPVWLQATYNPLYDTQGQLYGVMKLASNITQQVEQRQRESQATLLAQEIAVRTSHTAHRGEQAVLATADVVRHVKQGLGDVASELQALNEQSGKIGAMVDLIREVAVQTNLLSLNAAIEAARAGKEGRGFAVVANEVRSLAARTQQATAEIARVVEENKLLVNRAVTEMTRNRDQVETAALNAEQAGQMMHGIRDDAGQVVQAIERVASTLQAAT